MNIQSFVQTQEKRRTCNLAQFGGATSICTEDGEESRDCNPDLCRKFRNATFPAHLLPSGASGLERLERLEQLLHLLWAGGEPWDIPPAPGEDQSAGLRPCTTRGQLRGLLRGSDGIRGLQQLML